MSLSGKVSIITGGSIGIGRTIAQAFLKEGAKVIIASRTQEELERSVKELREQGDITGIRTDVSRTEDVDRLVAGALEYFGRVDILVNAAAVQGPIGPLVEVDIEQWIRCIQVDLIGTVLCCKAVLPVMRNNSKGKIINFSGGGATSARPNFSAYACAKTAVVRFTETLAMEVAGYNIDVNAIAPGVVKTRMMDEIAKEGSKAGEQEVAQIEKTVRDGGGSPLPAAELAVFLASDSSNGITGRLISAVWDDWRSPDVRDVVLSDSSLYTLRRIDGRSFVGVKK